MVEELRDAPPSNGHGEWTEMSARPSDAPYAALMGAFASLLLLGSKVGRSGDEPVRLGLSDLACIGLASHDIARVVSRDRIAAFLRAPFASGEAAQLPRGRGMQRAVGELLTCPHCLSLWIAGGLCAGYARFPLRARFVAGVFAGHAVANASAAIGERLVPT